MAQTVPGVARLRSLPRARSSECPISTDELAAYVRANAEGAEHIRPADLSFVRTARVRQSLYWVYRFRAADATECYALVMEDAEGAWMSWHRNEAGLPADEVVLADYRNML